MGASNQENENNQQGRTNQRHPTLPARVRRIAVLRALHLGDLLTAIPGLRALRAGFPEAEITFIGLPWARDFLRRYPYLDRFRECPSYPGIPETPLDRERLGSFLCEERAYGYDLAIQIHGNGKMSNGFIRDLDAKCTAGYHPPDDSGPWPTITLPYPDDRHEVLRVLGLMEYLGAPAGSTEMELPVLPIEREELSRLLERHGVQPGQRLVGINAGARAPTRRWEPGRFALVADTSRERWSATIVLTGGPSEQEIAGAVQATMRGPAINLAGETSLGMLAALMERCSLFVTNDSGPSHVATAIGVPSVTVFGPADVRRWAP